MKIGVFGWQRIEGRDLLHAFGNQDAMVFQPDSTTINKSKEAEAKTRFEAKSSEKKVENQYANLSSDDLTAVYQGHAQKIGAHVNGLSPQDQKNCLLYTSPSPRDRTRYRMPSSA